MADHQRVHPRADYSPSRDSFASSSSSVATTTTTTSYVIQIPKDQIYRIPPPENEYKFKLYTRQSKRRNSHYRCCCWTFSILLSIALVASIAVGVFYLIIRPQTPNYSVNSLRFSGFNNITTSSDTIFPRIDVGLTAHNPNKKISIDYRPGGYAAAYHNRLRLCDGALPIFHQPRQNVSMIETSLGGSATSSGLVLGSQSKDELAKELSAGRVPLRLNLRSPVRLQVGDVMTWTITVKVRCELVVDKLAADATILSNTCEFGVTLW